MASQSGEHNELNFTGESAEEAQDFVQAVHRRAYVAGRQKDNTWMAEFAFPCFSRKALVWYDALDEETRNDWQLLRRAILAKFTASPPAPATVPSAAPALVRSPSSTTTAAAPPAAMIVKIGRIRVQDSRDPTKSGYLCINAVHRLGTIFAGSGTATIFEVNTLGRTLTFQGSVESLAIRGHGPNSLLSPRTSMFACMMKSTADSSTQWNHTWSIAADGNITAMLLRTDGSQYDANFLVPQSFLNYAIQVPADKETFCRDCGGSWTRVTLRLEPLS